MTENREGNPEFSLITPEKAREPLSIYIFLMKCFNYSALPLVGDIYSRKWSYKNWRVLNVIFMLSWTTFLYAWNAYEFRHNPSQMFLSIMCLGFDVLGVQRFFKFIVGRDLMVLSAGKVRDFTEKWEKRSEGYRILVWYFNLIKTLVLSGMAIFFSIGIIITLAPLLIFLFTGRLQLVYPLYVPSVDSTTHPGFEFHVFLHILATDSFIVAVTPLVGFVLVINVMICAKIDVLCARLQILSEIVTRDNDADRNSKEITELLHEIYSDHQILLEYVDDCEELFTIQHLTDHFVVAAQICLSLYSLLKHSWYQGLLITVMGTFMLFTIDTVGTVIDLKFEKLLNEVWNVPWYLMDMKNKKSFCYFLANAQKTDRLSVGGRVPLSLNTFVQLYKGIYSYLMILLEMQN